MMETQINIYENLRDFRILNHKKQLEVANFLDIDESYYGKIERGEVDITWSKLVKLAEFYNTSLSKLCGQNIGHFISNLTHSPIAMEHSSQQIGNESAITKLIEVVTETQSNLLSLLKKISDKL
jgi:transcriptional regulator with XRE-family HTH domain